MVREKWTIERLRDRVREVPNCRWTVVGTEIINKRILCRCSCESQTEKNVKVYAVAYGTVLSCGCLRVEKLRKKVQTHGQTGTRSYVSWQLMKRRCYDSTCPDYPNYGGRGIKVCKKWLKSFEAFYGDLGDRPKGWTLERKNPNGNYHKRNCRWATRQEQNSNTRKTRRVTVAGKKMTVTTAAREKGMAPGTLHRRIVKQRMRSDIALSKSVQIVRRKHDYRGTVKTTKELSAISGVPSRVISERLREGWSPEEAAETPMDDTRKGGKHYWEGQWWTLNALAKHVQIPYNTLYSRIKTHHMGLEEAIRTPIKTSGRYQPRH